MSLALKLVLSPLLAAQAIRTRRTLPRLPEAEGARAGEVGRGPRLRLLIGGDSSAAGVGAQTQDEALAGHLSRELAQRCGARVAWQLFARSGLTSEQALAMLEREGEGLEADVAVYALGVNDVVDQVTTQRALDARAQLVQRLQQRHGVSHVVFAPLPPVHRFPGLPQPLRWVAGRDARRHDEALARWAQQRSGQGVSTLSIPMPTDTAVMARDGFHPGPSVYRLCGEALAAHIAQQVWPAHPKVITERGARR